MNLMYVSVGSKGFLFYDLGVEFSEFLDKPIL